MGSKNRIAKYIVPIIEERIKEFKPSAYIEPFVGGANIIDKVNHPKKIGSDNNKYLIALLQNLDEIENLPDEVTKEHYVDVRESYKQRDGRYEDWYIGAVGFLSSRNGRFFDGGYVSYCGENSKGEPRSYYDETKRNLLAQRPNLEGISFWNCDYTLYNLEKIKGCIFYCDIPYANVKKYSTSKDFDYDKFWNWAREASKNNVVLVSEQIAPPDWECIWEMEVSRSMKHDRKEAMKATEKLFEYRGE